MVVSYDSCYTLLHYFISSKLKIRDKEKKRKRDRKIQVKNRKVFK